MKPTLNKEAKDALIDALEKSKRPESDLQQFAENRGISRAISIVESFPVSDGWIPVSEYVGGDAITYNVEYDPQEHRTNEWIGIYYDNVFGKISNSTTHFKPLPNPPTSHK